MTTPSFFDSDGHRIAYYTFEPDTASDAPPVLLIHGFGSNAHVNWINTSWTRALTGEGRRVIAMDDLGHGASDAPHTSERYTTDTMATDAVRLLDHLGIPRADVMGYSMGARITARLALDHPERVDHAILSGLGINMVHGLGGTEAIAAALEAPSLDDVTDPAARPFRIFADQTGSDRFALAACIRASRASIPAAELGEMQVPTLVAVGTEDDVAGSGGELAALIPGARHLEIPGRDHMRAVGDPVHKRGVIAYLSETQAPE
ncbi:MAG: alpha/beta hydrolase [Pseudomonadota bacterium]